MIPICLAAPTTFTLHPSSLNLPNAAPQLVRLSPHYQYLHGEAELPLSHYTLESHHSLHPIPALVKLAEHDGYNAMLAVAIPLPPAPSKPMYVP